MPACQEKLGGARPSFRAPFEKKQFVLCNRFTRIDQTFLQERFRLCSIAEISPRQGTEGLCSGAVSDFRAFRHPGSTSRFDILESSAQDVRSFARPNARFGAAAQPSVSRASAICCRARRRRGPIAHRRNGKGVHREVESEGSCRQIASPTNSKRIEAAWWSELANLRKVRTCTERHGVYSRYAWQAIMDASCTINRVRASRLP